MSTERLKTIPWIIFSLFAGLSVFMLCTYPVVRVIAGKDTNFDFAFSFNFSVSIALTLALSVTGAGWYYAAKKSKHHKRRARDLETQVRELQVGQYRPPGVKFR